MTTTQITKVFDGQRVWSFRDRQDCTVLCIFTATREFASEQGAPFNWRLESVSGVAHSNRQISPAAADVLFARKFPSPARHSIRVLRCGHITLYVFGQKQP